MIKDIWRYNMVYKQAYIVNSDLGMGKGKIAGQVAHAAIYYMEELLLYAEGLSPENKGLFERFVAWRKEEHGMMKKIVLKATEDEMKKILCDLTVKGIEKFAVYDRGMTQIKENSFTCIVVEPLPEEMADELFGHLKLL